MRPMFERFTERARTVVVLAQEEARALGHAYLGSEHLLLGVLRERGAASHLLASAGVTHARVRDRLAELVAPTDEPGRTDSIPFTAAAKQVLELARREPRASG